MYFHTDIRKNLFLFVLSLALICLIYSKYLLSMCLIGLLSFIFFLPSNEKGAYFGFSFSTFQELFKPYKWWPFSGFLIYFVWIKISGLWSADSLAWWSDVQSKLGILGIAFIFVFFPRLSPKGIRWLYLIYYLGLFLGLSLLASVYIPDFQDITLRIGRGRPIPTPIDHVRFSMMVAYASLSALAIFLSHSDLGKKKYGFLFVSLFFFLACHVLAVRSGIIILYAGIFLTLVYIVISNRQWIVGGLGLLLLVLVPIIAYNTIESFRNKIYYSKHDLQQLIKNEGVNYSDGDRLQSIQSGIFLWKKSPFLGLGGGDYKQAMKDYYLENDQGVKSLLPHNQFVRSGMAYGWVGVLLLISGFFLAIIKNQGYRNLLLLLILLTFFLSLFVEASMERYYALVFFFLFMGINAMNEN